MRIYTKNDKILDEVISLLKDALYNFNYLKTSNQIIQSTHFIDDINDIDKLYLDKYSIIILKDLQGLTNKDSSEKEKILTYIEKKTNESKDVTNKILTIIVDESKESVDNLLVHNITLRDKVFDFELYTTELSTSEIYQAILDNLSANYTLTEEFKIELLNYITETYNNVSISSSEYIESLIDKILFNKTENDITEKTIPEYVKIKSTDEVFKELNELTGLDNVKKTLKELVDLLEFKSKTQDKISIGNTNLHMVFLGNPGTGKTTVARLLSNILYNLKYIKQNKLVEVSAKDLIGQYVGQTAPKTNEVIQRALGGILFIDEAYILASKENANSSFNEECVATLIQAMENYRDNLVVILAGYSVEMDAFLRSNSGIMSRIGYTIEFKDYTIDELITIFKSMVKKNGFVITDEGINKTKEIILEYMSTPSFGNARFVRNLYEKTVIKHASNVKNLTSSKALKTITDKDISSENLGKLN